MRVESENGRHGNSLPCPGHSSMARSADCGQLNGPFTPYSGPVAEILATAQRLWWWREDRVANRTTATRAAIQNHGMKKKANACQVADMTAMTSTRSRIARRGPPRRRRYGTAGPP